MTGREHFFLIPIPAPRPASGREAQGRPWIRLEQGLLWIDELKTSIRPQSIPYTTPFWYFHYNPNAEDRPFHSMTLNLNPACPEKCVLCAGAKTGRVNNGMDDTLSADKVMDRIFRQHPAAREQLDCVAIVTGCFENFDVLTDHLSGVKRAAQRHSRPSTYRVLEHNVTNRKEFDVVVRELGYDVFVTLECFDQENRNIALNGRVGRKGRDSREFLEMIEVYAEYLDAHPELGDKLVRVTYLMGIDSLEVSAWFLERLAAINRRLKRPNIVPWLSIFTPYDEPMRAIQRPDFSLKFLIDARRLCEQYFDPALLIGESGGTGDGYARGLF